MTITKDIFYVGESNFIFQKSIKASVFRLPKCIKNITMLFY